MSERTPVSTKPSHARRLKTEHRKALKAGVVSLKDWVRKLLPGANNTETHELQEKLGDLAEFAKAWLHNKRANTSNPPQRIGRTNRIKSGSKR